MTKQPDSDTLAARDRPTEITPAMIEEGVAAYASLAWHDSRSAGSPREVVSEVLRRGIAAGRPA